jgi:Family of unknown function (DUF6152)
MQAMRCKPAQRWQEMCSMINRVSAIYGAVITAGLALAVPASAVFAHHSPASYDLTKRTAITGTLKQALFRNPHGKMIVDVKVGNRVQSWNVETSAANLLRRRGWDFSKFKPGATITIYGHLNKTIKQDIYVREAKFADGVLYGDKDGNDKALD